MRILVIGSYGFLGVPLTRHLEAYGHQVYRQGRRGNAEVRCDPVDATCLRGVLREIAPDVIINLAAMTDVDRCEGNPAGAFAANAGTAASIARALEGREGTRLIHLSTDQVYSGLGPHAEEAIAPLNVYAITKYAGELAACRAGATILRVNFVGRSAVPERSGLSDWIVDSLAARRAVTLFDDVRFSPLHISTLCGMLAVAATAAIPGVFNLGARGGASKADFGLALASGLGLDARYVRVGKLGDVPMKARRPADMTMDVGRFERAFACELPTIENEIRRVIDDYGRDGHDHETG